MTRSVNADADGLLDPRQVAMRSMDVDADTNKLLV